MMTATTTATNTSRNQLQHDESAVHARKRVRYFMPAYFLLTPLTGKAALPVVDLKTIVIACSLAIFSAAEMKKPKARRESKVRLLEIPAMMEWVDFRMQLNARISDTLYPTAFNLDYSKFEATYTIPRLVPNALPLLASSDYDNVASCSPEVQDAIESGSRYSQTV